MAVGKNIRRRRACRYEWQKLFFHNPISLCIPQTSLVIVDENEKVSQVLLR